MQTYIWHAPECFFLIGFLVTLAIYYRSVVLLVITSLTVTLFLTFYRGAHIQRNSISPLHLHCPCDGKVLGIHRAGKQLHIAVFLNVHNVHVQYAPFDCIVSAIHHKPGTFHPAYLLEKSQYNERMEYKLHNGVFGSVCFTQIAGQLARRTKSLCMPGQTMKALQPLGLIKFGSRCDILIEDASGCECHLTHGQRVRIGDVLVTKRK